MKKTYNISLLIICVFLTSGCFSKKQMLQSSNQAFLKPSVAVTLPDLQQVDSFSVQQLLTAKHNGQEHSLTAMLELAEDKLTLIGLSTMGIRLFKLTYDEKGIKIEQSIVISEVPPPNQVLADIMLVYWPISAWQPLLPGGWKLEEQGNQRFLRDETNSLVSEIGYTDNERKHPVYVHHYIMGYEIFLKDLSQ